MPIEDPMMQGQPQGDPNMPPPGAQQQPQPGQPQRPPQEEGQSAPGDDELSEGVIAEAEKGMAAVGKALYRDEAMSDKILAMVSPEEGQTVGTTAQAAIMLVTEMDKQMDLDEEAIASVTVFAADRLMELVEADGRNNIQYSDMQAKQVIMTTMEGILMAYGTTPEDSKQVADALGEGEVAEHQKTYEETLNG